MSEWYRHRTVIGKRTYLILDQAVRDLPLRLPAGLVQRVAPPLNKTVRLSGFL